MPRKADRVMRAGVVIYKNSDASIFPLECLKSTDEATFKDNIDWDGRKPEDVHSEHILEISFDAPPKEMPKKRPVHKFHLSEFQVKE